MRQKRYKTTLWDDQWKIYNRDRYFKPNGRVISTIKECVGGRLKDVKVLELGAGSGSDIVNLTLLGAKGFAVDSSYESIKSIKYWAKASGAKVRIIRTDILKLPFINSYFDVVYSVGLMEHFNDPFPYIKEQVRVVKPGGFVVIDVPQKFTLYTLVKHLRMKWGRHPFGWEREFSRGMLRQLAKKVDQEVYMMYGRDLDLVVRMPSSVQPYMGKAVQLIEKTIIGEYVCLCIGVVLRIHK